MPWWVVADKPGKVRNLMMGPYLTEERADSVLDNCSDGHAEKYETRSWKEEEAAREIREKRANTLGVEKALQNFRHKASEE